MVFIYDNNLIFLNGPQRQKQINQISRTDKISCCQKLKELTSQNREFLLSLGFKLIQKRHRN